MKHLLLIGMVLAAGAAQAATPAYDGQALVKYAKISIEQAQAVALKARPGLVKDRELEKEAGGGGLRYSFDIESHGGLYEVGVDAKTGQVLENAREGKHPD
jgi:uncharacterized membrane protein YkoI